uniref:Uncharacterized protein n=1 Tax=Vespula pensylvanica TaxID=30213 RepID=A0A834UGK6_VESPE|nr:hypothetical protein H0235_000649 [Vespula pensylvanica]
MKWNTIKRLEYLEKIHRLDGVILCLLGRQFQIQRTRLEIHGIRRSSGSDENLLRRTFAVRTNSRHVWPEKSDGKSRKNAWHIARSDWLIEKPNSSKLIAIINSMRSALNDDDDDDNDNDNDNDNDSDDDDDDDDDVDDDIDDDDDDDDEDNDDDGGDSGKQESERAREVNLSSQDAAAAVATTTQQQQQQQQ